MVGLRHCLVNNTTTALIEKLTCFAWIVGNQGLGHTETKPARDFELNGFAACTSTLARWVHPECISQVEEAEQSFRSLGSCKGHLRGRQRTRYLRFGGLTPPH